MLWALFWFLGYTSAKADSYRGDRWTPQDWSLPSGARLDLTSLMLPVRNLYFYFYSYILLLYERPHIALVLRTTHIFMKKHVGLFVYPTSKLRTVCKTTWWQAVTDGPGLGHDTLTLFPVGMWRPKQESPALTPTHLSKSWWGYSSIVIPVPCSPSPVRHVFDIYDAVFLHKITLPELFNS